MYTMLHDDGHVIVAMELLRNELSPIDTSFEHPLKDTAVMPVFEENALLDKVVKLDVMLMLPDVQPESLDVLHEPDNTVLKCPNNHIASHNSDNRAMQNRITSRHERTVSTSPGRSNSPLLLFFDTLTPDLGFT